MATFEVKVYSLEIIPHPNAERLELAKVGDYLAIVGKDQFKTGDLGVYIPEQAVLPDNLIEDMNLVGKLAGKAKNRVRAVKLRGVLSQGLVYPNKGNWNEGDILNDELEIIKYEPVVPAHFAGEMSNVGEEYTLKYDIENFKRHPDVLTEGEMVQFTEKLHGTFSMFTAAPSDEDNEKLIDGRFAVSSKGLGSKGLVFKDNEKNANNIYLNTVKKLNLFEFVGALADRFDNVVTIAGEIFGAGVQDLAYGCEGNNVQFRLFDIAVGRNRSEKRYLDHYEVEEICKEFDIERVPVLYVGEFNKEVLEEYTNGFETISGTESHIREGIVIKPLKERYEHGLGRVLLKSISEHYLLRKGGTEFN